MLQAFDGFHAPDHTKILEEVKGCFYDNRGDSKEGLRHRVSVGIYEEIRGGIRNRMGSAAELTRMASLKKDQVGNFLRGAGTSIKDVAAMLDALGARVVFPDEERNKPREVCWVDAKAVGAENGGPPLAPERYLAVPLAEGPVAAGPGMIPQDEVKSWVLVLKDHPSVSFRTNLVAVEVGKGQESMEPLLHPLDIVLVDKDDTRPEPGGQIFLVREPDDSVTVKRVFIQRNSGEVMLNLVSDNPNKRLYPPMLYSLSQHYDGEMRRAIIGKCVWAWSDLTRK